MIREHPCEKVIELDADHAPYLSATKELVAAISELAAHPAGRASAERGGTLLGGRG
jgi:hypothetical protein